MTVLILGGTDDAHACHVLERLRGRSVDVELFDSRWFPTEMRLSYEPGRETGTLHLPGGRSLPLAAIRAVYWRCYNAVNVGGLTDPGQAYIAGNDARALFESLLIRLPARWVNGWTAFQLHQTKPVQLAMIASLGIPIPATLLGNDPEAVRSFAARHPRCIFKPVQGGAHTLRLGPEHLTDENLRNLAFAPITLQEEVPGTNIRVFVAGERVLSCEVVTQSIDFRDDPDPRIIPHPLPDEVSGWCLKAARELRLLWTGIDLRRTDEGKYVFLEANPSPMFIGFETRSGLPLTDSLLALLADA
jgi:hypothetical protein